MDFNTMLNQMAAQQQGIPLDMTRREVNEGQDFLPENVQLQERPMRIQVPVHMDSLMEKSLVAENNRLRREVEQLQNALTNSKLDTAGMYAKFGEFAKDWSNVVKHLEEMQLQQKNNYESRIKSLEEKNEQLMKENEEMKKVIKDFEKVKLEFEKQKRQLKIGQVAYKLESLVSEYVFPGQDKASKRARYGTNLKSLKGKIDRLKDLNVQDRAKSRFPELNEELFEDWFFGVVKKMKCSRLDTAHPNIGTYEEIKAVIYEEFGDPDECDDMLIALDHLREMYLKMGRSFGE